MSDGRVVSGPLEHPVTQAASDTFSGHRTPLHRSGTVGIDYAGLVVSPACFARAESRSSLSP